MKTGPLIFILFFVVAQADADVETTFYHPAAAAYIEGDIAYACLLYTSPSPRDA